ncbi:MAG: hypothetical protein PVG19_01765, partial [Desulfobacterales bacterium]
AFGLGRILLLGGVLLSRLLAILTSIQSPSYIFGIATNVLQAIQSHPFVPRRASSMRTGEAHRLV